MTVASAHPAGEADASRQADPSSIDLLPIAVYLLRRKRVVLAYLLAAAALGLVASLLWPASYTSTTEILPPQQRQSAAAAMLSEASAGAAALASAGSELQARSVAETYVHMLQAQPVVDGLIQQYGLQTLYRKRYRSDTRKALASHTAIVASKEGFVSITVTDRDRNRAASMANSYVDQLRILTRHLALTESSQRRLFYETQLAHTREDLSQAELAFKSVQQSKGVISLDAEARTMIESAAQLRAQIAAKEVELQRLRGFATANNPQVQSTEDELRALRAQLGQVAAGSAGYGGMGLGNVPAAELVFVRASREMRYQESVYELLMKQYEAARMDEARDAPNVQVLQVASPAERAAWPKKTVIVALAGLLGLLLGCLRVGAGYWAGTLEPARKRQIDELRRAAWGGAR